MKNNGKTNVSVKGYFLFFLTITVTVTLAVLIYSLVAAKSGGNTLIISITMLLIIIVLSLLCTISDVIRRKIMVEKPMEKILQATEKIAHGDFTVHLEILHSAKKYDEYDIIMENLNKMAAELSKSEVFRTDFISNVSHELKTPLTVIQTYAMAIQNENLDSDTRSKYAKTLVASSKRLTDLVANILKLNKLENQEIKPPTAVIRLDEMLAEIILQFEELIDEKHIQLDCDMDELTIRSSPSYLEIVWNNLLSNAVKFTDIGGAIRVSLKGENKKAIVKISDTGCGISKEVGEHIFDKFYQGDTSHSQEGNGLGLALVKKVIDIIGGEISVESQIGKGSAFTVELKNE